MEIKVFLDDAGGAGELQIIGFYSVEPDRDIDAWIEKANLGAYDAPQWTAKGYNPVVRWVDVTQEHRERDLDEAHSWANHWISTLLGLAAQLTATATKAQGIDGDAERFRFIEAEQARVQKALGDAEMQAALDAGNAASYAAAAGLDLGQPLPLPLPPTDEIDLELGPLT